MIKPNKLRKTKWYRSVVAELGARGYVPANEVQRFLLRVFKHRSLDVTEGICSGHRIVITVFGMARLPIVAERLDDVNLIISAAELDCEFPD